MSAKYKIITLEEAYDLLNENGFKSLNRPLSFTFDVRKRCSNTDREWNTWYAFQYCACTDIIFLIGVCYAKDQFEACLEHTRMDTLRFMQNYCEKYYSNFTGEICIDWHEWEQSNPEKEWQKRGWI